MKTNDYRDVLSVDSKLHVLWLNKSVAGLLGQTTRYGFSRDTGNTENVYRKAAEYAPTFKLLDRLGREVDDDGAKSRPPVPLDLQGLADELLIDSESLRKVARLLADKRQVIFQGPPGTGKTYVARKLAAFLAGTEQRVRLVQFHPSYAYEDFVQGLSPTLTGGQVSFEVRDGPLLTMAKAARGCPVRC